MDHAAKRNGDTHEKRGMSPLVMHMSLPANPSRYDWPRLPVELRGTGGKLNRASAQKKSFIAIQAIAAGNLCNARFVRSFRPSVAIKLESQAKGFLALIPPPHCCAAHESHILFFHAFAHTDIRHVAFGNLENRLFADHSGASRNPFGLGNGVSKFLEAKTLDSGLRRNGEIGVGV